jgi:hypothetical protein
LVATLSAMDSPVTGRPPRTQFLIAKDEREFDGQNSGYLAGLSPSTSYG